MKISNNNVQMLMPYSFYSKSFLLGILQRLRELKDKIRYEWLNHINIQMTMVIFYTWYLQERFIKTSTDL